MVTTPSTLNFDGLSQGRVVKKMTGKDDPTISCSYFMPELSILAVKKGSDKLLSWLWIIRLSIYYCTS